MAPNSELSTNTTPVQQMPEEDIATNTNKFIVKYRKNYYDISEFLHKHPGGINTLKGLQNSDMTSRFMKAPPHSDAAMYLMQEYKMQTANTKSKLNGLSNGHGTPHDAIKENIEIIEESDNDANNNNSSNSKNNSSTKSSDLDESMEVSLTNSKILSHTLTNESFKHIVFLFQIKDLIRH